MTKGSIWEESLNPSPMDDEKMKRKKLLNKELDDVGERMKKEGIKFRL